MENLPNQTSGAKNIFSPQGRIGRVTYFAWLSILGCSFFTIFGLLFALSAATGQILQEGSSPPVFLIFSCIILVCIAVYLSFIFMIRRLHDLNHTGWLSLLTLLPFLGSLFQIYIYFAKGQAESNQFGQPRPTQQWEKVVTIVSIVGTTLFFLLIVGIAVPQYHKYIEKTRLMQQQQLIDQSNQLDETLLPE